MAIEIFLMRFMRKLFSRRIVGLTATGYNEQNERQQRQAPLFYSIPLEIWDQILLNIDPYEHNELFDAAPLLAVRFHHFATQQYKFCFRYRLMALPAAIEFADLPRVKLQALAARVIRQFDSSQLRRLVNWSTMNRHPETLRLLLQAGLTMEYFQYPIAVYRLYGSIGQQNYNWLQSLLGQPIPEQAPDPAAVLADIQRENLEFKAIAVINGGNVDRILANFQRGVIAKLPDNVVLSDRIPPGKFNRITEYCHNNCFAYGNHRDFIEFTKHDGVWQLGTYKATWFAFASEVLMSKRMMVVRAYLAKYPACRGEFEMELNRLRAEGQINRYLAKRMELLIHSIKLSSLKRQRSLRDHTNHLW